MNDSEFSFQVTSKAQSETRELKNKEVIEMRAIIGKWSQKEYEVRQSTWRHMKLDAFLTAAEGTSTNVTAYVHSEYTSFLQLRAHRGLEAGNHELEVCQSISQSHMIPDAHLAAPAT